MGADLDTELRSEHPTILRGPNKGRIRVVVGFNPNSLGLLDVQQNLALYWVDESHQLPYYERVSPVKAILHWWMGDHSRQFVHSGAVGIATGGVLLAGKGGSGKSTTTLGCLEAGMLYAGDNYCLVSTAPVPYVYGLYNTATLRGVADMERFPGMMPHFSNTDRLDTEKAMIFLYKYCPERLATGFPLKAILVPRITGQPETRLRATTDKVAFAALAPSTLSQLPGASQAAIQRMLDLVRKTPCYELEVGTYLPGIPDTIMLALSGG